MGQILSPRAGRDGVEFVDSPSSSASTRLFAYSLTSRVGCPELAGRTGHDPCVYTFDEFFNKLRVAAWENRPADRPVSDRSLYRRCRVSDPPALPGVDENLARLPIPAPPFSTPPSATPPSSTITTTVALSRIGQKRAIGAGHCAADDDEDDARSMSGSQASISRSVHTFPTVFSVPMWPELGTG
uniref:Uncharacterized protein n=1 Tax=Plectus sambesii TaxID=2011161 RepID=A0A914WXS2_9BILA